MTSDPSAAFFGELYLRSTRPFLGAAISALESDYLARVFTRANLPPGPIVDLGCGHGRHASRLQGRLGSRAVLGLERDPLSLAEREGDFPACRGDLRQLPFKDHSAAGAFAWYSTLFGFEDSDTRGLLAEVARCLSPGALLVVHTAPRERLERAPRTRFEQVLPDGSLLREESHFDPATGRDHGHRQLTTPDGRMLSAQYFIRYYHPPELAGLLEAAGFAVRFVHGGLDGEAVSADSADLIVGAERNG